MKIKSLVPRLLAMLAVAAASHAAIVAAQGYTNVVQNISIQLTYLTQGPYKTNRPATNEISATVNRATVSTKDVIGWLGTATTNTFPAGARLVRVRHFNADTNFVTIEVRYSTNSVDVSPLFADTASSENIDASTYNEVTKLSTGTEYEILHLTLTNAAPYNLVPFFRVNGLATLTYVGAISGKTHLLADQITATTLAGPGMNTNGVPALVTGSATITGIVTEIK